MYCLETYSDNFFLWDFPFKIPWYKVSVTLWNKTDGNYRDRLNILCDIASYANNFNFAEEPNVPTLHETEILLYTGNNMKNNVNLILYTSI